MSSTSTAPVDDRSLGDPGIVRRMFASTAFYVLVVDAVLFLVFTLLSRDLVFASPESITALLRYTTQALVLALAFGFMLGAGIFDLSLGSNLVLSSVVGALVLRATGQTGLAPDEGADPGAVVLALLAALAAGAVFGLVNGLIIAVLKVTSLIATLATLGIGMGIALVVSGGADIIGMPRSLQTGFGTNTLGVFPLPMLVAIVLAAALALLVRRTRFGLRSLALGSNAVSAERSGMNVRSHVLRLTVLGGVLAGFAGFLDLATYGQTALNGHALDGLNAVAAVIIGGGSLLGGRISVMGTIAGALLATILLTGLIVTGVSSFYQQIAIGIVLVVAVAVDGVRSGWMTRR